MTSFLHSLSGFFQVLSEHPLVPIFLLVNLAIGIWAHRKAKVNSFDDYAMASRSLPTGVLVMTLLATHLSTGELGNIDRFFANGMVNGLSLCIITVSFLCIGTFIAPCLIHFNKSITVGGLMGRFYGRVAQFVTGVVGFFFSLLIIASQISTIGTISSILLNIDFSTSVLFFGGLVVVYSVFGGMRAVSYTDVLQMVAVLLVFSWVAQKAVFQVGGLTSLFGKLSLQDPKKVAFFSHPNFYFNLKLAVFWAFPFSPRVVEPPIVQRMLMVHNKKEVRKMWYISALLLGLIFIGSALIAFAACINEEGLGVVGGHNVLPNMINTLFKDHYWVRDMMFVGLIGMLLSTMDSYLHTMSISFVEDVIGPLRSWWEYRPLAEGSKVRYARIGIVLTGVLSIWLGLQVEGTFSTIAIKLRVPAMLLHVIVTVPLIIGIIGLKTDRASWISFCIMYLGTVGMLSRKGWGIYDFYLVAMPLGLVAFFIAHILQNGGIVTLKRSERAIAEQLWLPTWKCIKAHVKCWVSAPFGLAEVARKQAIKSPMSSLTFSVVIFGFYMLGSFVLYGDRDIANFIAGVHLVGIMLCCGLMMEGIWPDRLKRYFALYWFITVFYCLPLGSTLSLLCGHQGAVDTMLWLSSFILLASVVDSGGFFVLGMLGTGLAFAGWRFVMGALPPDLWTNQFNIASIGCLVVVIISVLFFGRTKGNYMGGRLYWNCVASNSLGHELRGSLQMLDSIGRMLEKSFKEGDKIPKEQQEFLSAFYKTMIDKAEKGKKEITRFTKLIEQQVFGVFEKQEVGIRMMVEEGISKVADKYAGTLEVDVSCEKDFEAKLLPGIFPNVMSNLLSNAFIHGRASRVNIKIDGEQHKVYVRDNGKGIPPDVLPHIFDLHYTTTGAREGSGVGLAFAKMVLEASGGKIICHSRCGDKGSFTEFVMELAPLE